MSAFVDIGRTEQLPPHKQNPFDGQPPHFVDPLFDELLTSYDFYDRLITSDPDEVVFAQQSDMGALIESRGQILADYHYSGASDLHYAAKLKYYYDALTTIGASLARKAQVIFGADLLVNQENVSTISRTVAARSIAALICAEEAQRFSQMEVRYGWQAKDRASKNYPNIYRFGPVAVSRAWWEEGRCDYPGPVAYYSAYNAVDDLYRTADASMAKLFDLGMRQVLYRSLAPDLGDDAKQFAHASIKPEAASFDSVCRPIIGRLIGPQLLLERQIFQEAAANRSEILAARKERLRSFSPLSWLAHGHARTSAAVELELDRNAGATVVSMPPIPPSISP